METSKSKKPPWKRLIHDRTQIAIDLVEWAEKDDSINFCKFCATKNIRPAKLTQWSHEDPEGFGEAYDIAKAHLGYRREEWLNSKQLHVKAYENNASVYDHFMGHDKREHAKFESDLRKDESKQIPSVNFKVNYAPGTGNPIEILPESISTQGAAST